MNRIIQWFVENSVAANLAMVVILVGGIASIFQLNKEAFPAANTGIIEISVPYPGAGPKEVEEQIIIRIEEAVGNLNGIEEISSVAREGSGSVQIEAVQGHDVQKLLNEVETRVDAINTFPDDAERVQVREVQWRTMIMDIGVSGEVTEAALKETAQHLRDELALLPNIDLAELAAVREDQIAVEVSEETLRRYNLTFQQVVNAISSSSLNLPAGTIETSAGDIQLQTRGQAYYKEDFEEIVVATNRDGAKLYLGDVADIQDSFVDTDRIALLDGKPAVFVRLYITDDPDVLKAREQVHNYIAQVQETLPAGIDVNIWRDNTEMFKDRMNLLLKNALSGLALVFVVLMLFLRPVLSVWVCVGITISFMGCLWLLPYIGVSLNMISLFGFLLVLGIVVDDAIIVGESIYARHEQGLRGNAAAASGTKLVSKPVIFAVISSMVFFSPMLFVPGQMGTMAAPIGYIVLLCLVFSLVESLLILPSHLSHIKEETTSRYALINRWDRVRSWFGNSLHRLADNVYQPFLHKALRNNGITIACFAVAFLLALAVFVGGWLRVGFMPIIESDQIDAEIVLAEGAPFEQTETITEQVVDATEALRADPAMLQRNNGTDFVDNIRTWAQDNAVRVTMALKSPEVRDISTRVLARRWRELIGEIPEAEEIRIGYTINNRSADIRLQMSITSDATVDQERAVSAVKSALATYPGTYDIKDNLQSPRNEIELVLKDNAEVLGLTLTEIARQVRRGFYGEEVQRVPRDKEDVRVIVRYPEAERRRVDQLDDMRIRTQDGREVPLLSVVDINYVPGYSTIRRLNRKRTIVVTAELQEGYNANEIVRDVMSRNREEWEQQFPGFTIAVGGNLEDQAQFQTSLFRNFIFCVFAIYGLMAVAFRSYWQPVIVLTAIPFGFMGAVIGHLLMGREVSMMSMLGFVACAGVVVNDNLVLLDRIGRLRKRGTEVFEAVAQAGRDRFRAIILTSVTTFVGLTPILAEQSTQARFLIPMVISLAFGVIFATTVTLVLVPCLFLMGDNVMERFNFKRRSHDLAENYDDEGDEADRTAVTQS